MVVVEVGEIVTEIGEVVACTDTEVVGDVALHTHQPALAHTCVACAQPAVLSQYVPWCGNAIAHLRCGKCGA